MGTPESEPLLYYKYRLTDIVQRQSQRTSQLVIVIKIKLTWPGSYPVKGKKKPQKKY